MTRPHLLDLLDSLLLIFVAGFHFGEEGLDVGEFFFGVRT